MFVPALIEETDVPGWSTSWVEHGGWVMGFSLKVQNKKYTLLPVSVLRKLQVNLAHCKSIGQHPDCEFHARQYSASFKFGGMSILVEYSSQKQDRIDVLVKALLQLSSKRDQMNVAQKFVNDILTVVNETSVGVELDKRIIKPWSVASGHLELKERDIKLGAAPVIEGIMERGEQQMRQWEVGGEAVWDDDLLSDEDLSEFLQIISRKLKFSKQAKKCLDSSNTKSAHNGEAASTSGQSTPSGAIGNLNNQNVKLYDVLIDYFRIRFTELEENQSKGFAEVVGNQKRIYAEVMHMKGKIRKLCKSSTH